MRKKLQNIKLLIFASVGLHEYLSGLSSSLPGLSSKPKEAFENSKKHDEIFKRLSANKNKTQEIPKSKDSTTKVVDDSTRKENNSNKNF